MKRQRPDTAINASSMADIAFLLLIFFLVTTTIDYDKGIQHTLPRLGDTSEGIANKRNVLIVLLNAKDELLINNQPATIGELRHTAKEFLDNRGANPLYSDSATVAIISLQNDKGTSYGTYLQVQNELKAAYRELRDAYALRHYGQTYEVLMQQKLPAVEQVKNAYPMRLSEAEPFASAD